MLNHIHGGCVPEQAAVGHHVLFDAVAQAVVDPVKAGLGECVAFQVGADRGLEGGLAVSCR